MPFRILVLHGPNLNLLAGKGGTLAELDAQLASRAKASGVELKTVQSNHEGVLLDALAEHRGWLDAIIVNAASLAPNAHGLAEAIGLIGKPAIEVDLDESRRAKSVLKNVVKQQLHGRGFDGYLEALSALAPKAGAVKTLGRKSEPVAEKPPSVAKTLGRKVADKKDGVAVPAGKTLGKKAVGAAQADVGLSRGLVRKKIAERLAGRISPSGLSTWARTQWQELQRGAPVEAGQREQLEDVLQTLLLSAVSKTSDNQLITLMTQLDG